MYKKLEQDDVTTTQYEARKRWRLDDTAPQLTFHAGANLDGPFLPDQAPKNASGTYLRTVYEMMRHTYYREDATAYDRFGVIDSSAIDLSTFPREENAIIYVLKISSNLYGQKVVPGSFYIQSDTDEEVITAVDDGNGNLVLEGTDTQIGNLFYTNGVAVLTQPPEQIFQLPGYTNWPNYTFEEIIFGDEAVNTGFPDYEQTAFDLLFQDFDLEFQSVVKNYEHEIAAPVETDQFGATINESAREDEGNPIAALEDGDFEPYVTQAGFYNDDKELIATGKLARPIKLAETTPVTILARFDT